MIHESAIVSPNAEIKSNVHIGPFTIVHDNVCIGENTIIDAHCEIGYPTPLSSGNPLIIERNSKIRSHSVFYEGSRFGENLITGHRVTVRENTIAGRYFQIGTLADIQGDCEIGDHVRTQSYVFIGKKARIGNYVWLLPHVVLTNDPHPPSDLLLGVEIKDYVVVAAMSVILPGVTLNEHCLVGANSLVTNDVPRAMVAYGNPAKVIGEASKIQLKHKEGNAYPWPKHFHRGYPETVVKEWIEKFEVD